MPPAAGLQVRAGDVLAFALSSNHTYYSHPGAYQQYHLHMSVLNPHPGGDFYIYSSTLWGPEPFLIRDSFDPPYDTRDLGFQVYVRIPEPSTLALTMLAAAMFRCQRRRPRSPSF
jgi:hypothetical protein